MRTGIFGGSFNPPHIGHYLTTCEVIEKAFLDRIIIIPTGITPLKETQPMATPQQRYQMCEMTFGFDERFIFSDIEIVKSPAVSYTIDTVKTLKANVLKDDDLCIIIGIDQYNQFTKWKNYKELLELANLVVMNRAGHEIERDNNIPASFVEVSMFQISSTDIRRRVALEKSIKYLVSGTVETFIQNHKLYK
jgi:nicotinate-nucleotide adenylyltransferase